MNEWMNDSLESTAHSMPLFVLPGHFQPNSLRLSIEKLSNNIERRPKRTIDRVTRGTCVCVWDCDLNANYRLLFEMGFFIYRTHTVIIMMRRHMKQIFCYLVKTITNRGNAWVISSQKTYQTNQQLVFHLYWYIHRQVQQSYYYSHHKANTENDNVALVWFRYSKRTTNS